MNDWTPPPFMMLNNIFMTSKICKDKETGKMIEVFTMLNIRTGEEIVKQREIEENK